jgi:hypothetical protein
MQAEILYLLGNNGDRIPYVVANASAIAIGDFLELADNRIVTAHAGNVDTPIVGIAAHEKKVNDGHLSMTAITNCVFKATVLAGGSATIGDEVSMGNAAGEINLASSLDGEKGWAVGRAEQTAAAAETVFIRSKFN